MVRPHVRVVLAVLLVLLATAPALAGDYEHALNGVTKFNAVFDFTHKDPKIGNIILQAMDEAGDAAEVAAMPSPPQFAVVLHDAAVFMLTKDQGDWSDEEWADVQKFQEGLKSLKEQGVNLEVCAYALDAFGVDRSRVIPEIDQVPNGFVSVIGYEQQGYSVVRIP